MPLTFTLSELIACLGQVPQLMDSRKIVRAGNGLLKTASSAHIAMLDATKSSQEAFGSGSWCGRCARRTGWSYHLVQRVQALFASHSEWAH